MKKNIIVVLLLLLLVMPIKVFAADKTTSLGLNEVLKEEEIEVKSKNYKEKDNQVIIYLFRGSGCGYCYKFLNFLNDLDDEYKNKIKLVSYEVWNDEANKKLLDKVGTFLEQPAQGVPYIVIGDQVFAGYADVYDESIKAKIDELYSQKPAKRYDVMKEMAKKDKASNKTTSDSKTIVCNIIIAAISTSITLLFVNYKFSTLDNKASKKKN